MRQYWLAVIFVGFFVVGYGPGAGRQGLAKVSDSSRTSLRRLVRHIHTLAGEWGVGDFHHTFSPHLFEDTFSFYIDLDALCSVKKCIHISGMESGVKSGHTPFTGQPV